MYPLQLSINPEGMRLFLSRKTNPSFQKLQVKIFERDRYSCQFCGFQAQEYQEVINLDHYYQHNTLSNMATACCFCSQCFFIENVGLGDFGGGKLIYLPEMTQSELNSFCHVIFCAMTNGTSYRNTAQSVYRSLKFRTQPIEDKFGVGTSNPYIFAQPLLEYEGREKETIIKQTLEKFRLLPSYARFKIQLDRWAASAAEELAEKQ